MKQESGTINPSINSGSNLSPTSTNGLEGNGPRKFFKSIYLNVLYRKIIVLFAIILSIGYISFAYHPQIAQNLSTATSSAIESINDASSSSSKTNTESASSLKPLNPKLEKPEESYEIANETLGFQKFYYLNTKTGHSYSDLITLQSIISGVNPTEFESLKPDEVNEKGLPPAEYQKLKSQGKAVYRSHANLWQHMITNNVQTALIMSHDVTWDVNIKEMMAYFSKGLEEFLTKQKIINSEDETADDSNPNKFTPKEHISAEDPYLHKNWDVLMFGSCNQHSANKDRSIEYHDPYSPVFYANENKEGEPQYPKYFGKQLSPNTRVIRQNAEESCVSAYAITQAGALKLLLTSDVDMGSPIDDVIRDMVVKGRLNTFSVYPVLFAKWQYLDQAKGKTPKEYEEFQKLTTEEKEDIRSKELSFWVKVKETFVVWKYSPVHEDSAFNDGALFKLKEFFKPREQYKEVNEN